MKHDSKKPIETVAEFVMAFGGTAAMAEFLDVGMSCVSNWKRENCIPTGWHYRLSEEAKRRNIEFSRRVFGLDDGNGPFEQPARVRRRGRPRAGMPSFAA